MFQFFRLALLVAFTLATLNVGAVTFDEDQPARPGHFEKTSDLQRYLLEVFPVQKSNGQHVALAFEKALRQGPPEGGPGATLEQAMNFYFESAVKQFDPAVQDILKFLFYKPELETEWIRFSNRAEHTLVSRPLGELRYASANLFYWHIDERIKTLPLTKKLLKMIVLTHVAGPQLTLDKEQGSAFWRSTYVTQDLLTQASGFWALSSWVTFVQTSKVLEREIKTSDLDLISNKRMFEFIHNLHQTDPREGLNSFLKSSYPLALRSDQLKEYLKTWFNESNLRSASLEQAQQIQKEKKRSTVVSFTGRVTSKKSMSQCEESLSNREDEPPL